MKRNIFSIGIMVVGLLFGTISSVEAIPFKGIEFTEGAISFADKVVSYTPGSGSIAPDRTDPSAALGIPDGSIDDINYVSLGDLGTLILQFTDNSLTTSGNSDSDLWIFEIGANEFTDISISTNGIDWVYVGATSSNIAGIDIDAYIGSGVVIWEKYSYIKIQDLSPSETGYPSPGADIDAVGAISSTTPVPEPTTMLLFSFALAGLALSQKKIGKNA